MQCSYDVVIVGGAAIGSAIAAFLARESDGRLSILVVERDPSYSRCSTTLSLSSIRQQFSCPENIAISQFGVHVLKNLGDYLAVDGDLPDVAFHEAGYLILASADGLATLEHNHAIQRSSGVEVELLDPEGLQGRFPWISTEGIAGGSLGLSGEGWFDAYTLLRAYRRKARSLGVTYLDAEVVGFDLGPGGIERVRTSGGAALAAGTVVNAAGPVARRVAAMAGVDLPVHPRKRSVFVFDCRTPVPGCPLVADPSGVYVRPEGAQFVAGSTPGETEDADCEDFEVEWWRFEEIIWPALARRIPAFEAIKPAGAWAGHYAVNPHDHNAILGPHPEVTNFVFANGFSGHGLQQSPAVGRGIAELIVHGGYRSLDLTPFGYERFAAGRLIRELNVI